MSTHLPGFQSLAKYHHFTSVRDKKTVKESNTKNLLLLYDMKRFGDRVFTTKAGHFRNEHSENIEIAAGVHNFKIQ